MQVVLGGVDIQKDEAYDQVIAVENAIVHEGYRKTPNALYNDIGEVFLNDRDVTNAPVSHFLIFLFFLNSLA